MLKQRIITALWLVPLALVGFFALQGAAYYLFIAAVVGLAAWEWARLAGYDTPAQRVVYGLFVALNVLILSAQSGLLMPLLYLAGVWWIVAIAMVVSFPASVAYWGGNLGKRVMGLVILLPAGLGLLALKQQPQGNWLILSLMLLVWCADI